MFESGSAGFFISLVYKIDFRAILSRRRIFQKSQDEAGQCKAHAYAQKSWAPSHFPRAVQSLCVPEPKNPGSMEPAEDSEFFNLTADRI
jgi:hypothetical protein